MKTQITNLINGSEFTVRNINAEKYISNPVTNSNKPANGGTPLDEREAIVKAVADENPSDLHILANGVELTLTRHNSLSGRLQDWFTEISAEQYEAIIGTPAPTWSHKGAKNQYGIRVNCDCTVSIEAGSGKKSCDRVVGEEFIVIL